MPISGLATSNYAMSPMPNGWAAYTPILSGSTDNPVATYTTQIGRFFVMGALVFFKYKLVTSTMTKTTLTDLLNINVPIIAATNASDVATFIARVENATAVANMVYGELASNAIVATYRNYALAASSSQSTYAVTTPGIGVLTNTITFQGSGFYEF